MKPDLYLFHSDTACMGLSPVTSDGAVVGDANGLLPENAGRAFVRPYYERFDLGTLPDLIWTPGSSSYVVSNSAKVVVEQHRLGASIGWMPTTIQSEKGIDLSHDYWCLYSSSEFDIADYDLSDVKWCDDIAVTVRRWVVSVARIPEFDLFYASPNDWFATESLKRAFDVHQITGAKFTPVEAT